MAKKISIIKGDKNEIYQSLLPQIKALVADETDRIANLANICAAISQTFHFLWVGFYRVEKDELILGPFQGPVACTRIEKNAGVCGTAWAKNTTVIVENVDNFPGHIACSSASKSEIVVPVKNASGELIYVLDIDSDQLACFDTVDQKYLEEIVAFIQ